MTKRSCLLCSLLFLAACQQAEPPGNAQPDPPAVRAPETVVKVPPPENQPIPVAESTTQESAKTGPRPLNASHTIYVAQSYDDGIDAVQTLNLVRVYYAYHFQFIRGIRRVEVRETADAAHSGQLRELSLDELRAARGAIHAEEIAKVLAEQAVQPAEGRDRMTDPAIPRLTLILLTFEPGTDMTKAMQDVAACVRRALAFMPPGVRAPFVYRLAAFRAPLLGFSFLIPIGVPVAGGVPGSVGADAKGFSKSDDR